MNQDTSPHPSLAGRNWVKAQYRTPDNLNARARLHQRFSTNPQSWFDWVIDHLTGSQTLAQALPPKARILELGGGPGLLWEATRLRLGADWQIVFTDQSMGMLTQATTTLHGLPQFRFAAVDAQALPFAAASFDIVIANHMLYHVPDRAHTFAEVRRVLAPGGRFFAATNDRGHLHEIDDLARDFLRRSAPLTSANDRFPFDVAQRELSAVFDLVQLHRYENLLVVTDADALADYILSGISLELPQVAQMPLRLWLKQKLAQTGSITITPATGLFEATLR